MNILVGDIKLNLTAGTAIKGGQTVTIRAKTLQVLKYLLANKEEIVNKKTLIDIIWHDVVVQDQVLVQSIKEIRDLCGSSVIKTYPRLGYQWVAEVTDLESSTTSIRANDKIKLLVVIPLVLLFVIGLSVKVFQPNTEPKTLSVAFLPVENNMPDNIHEWVPIEGMQYLSERLRQNSQLTVLEPDSLLMGLNAAENISSLALFKRLETPGQVLALKKKLNVDLLVKTRLLGYPQDFQLDYTLFLEHNIERGVELSSSVNSAFDQLTQLIATRYDQSSEPEALSAMTLQHHFSNEAFSRGMRLYTKRAYTDAIPLFDAALQDNPNLLAARRGLAASYVNTGDVISGITLMLENIEQAKKLKFNREEIRGLLMLGVLYVNWPEQLNIDRSNLMQAEYYIDQAKELASKHGDKLFIAYTFEELGKIKRLELKFNQAIELQKSALDIHQEFYGNYGQTSALIELARVFAAQKKFTDANEYLKRATEVANQNSVVTNKVFVLLAKADVLKQQNQNEQAMQMANQAMALAIQAKSDFLITRIAAWIDNKPYYEIN